MICYTIWWLYSRSKLLENLKLVAEIHIKEKDLRQAKIEKIIAQFEFEDF